MKKPEQRQSTTITPAWTRCSLKLVVGGLPVIVDLLPLCFKAVAFRPTLGTLALMDHTSFTDVVRDVHQMTSP
jgi:hypothetical protein